MQIFYQPLITENQFFLDADESRHCVKVLRKKEGDLITVADGQGRFYEARISHRDPRQCTFTIEKTIEEGQKDFHIHIGIAPTKNADRLEWFVEKAVEIGVDEISLVITENAERKKMKTDRLERKAISAMKQSLKATLPPIHPPVSLTGFLHQSQPDTQKYLAYVSELPVPHLFHVASSMSRYVILIGPEGDFTPEEVSTAQQHGYQMVSLGTSRLRTETAGMVACHTLTLLNEKIRSEAGHKT